MASGIVAAAPVVGSVVHGSDVRRGGPAPEGSNRPVVEQPQLAAEVAEFLGLEPGARLDRWTVVAARGPHLGAIAVVLATEDGSRFQVDVLRRSETANGPIASTRSVEVYLSNRGDGRTPTAEEQGLGAMALAAHLAARESAGARTPELLTRDERRERHPVGAYRISV